MSLGRTASPTLYISLLFHICAVASVLTLQLCNESQSANAVPQLRVNSEVWYKLDLPASLRANTLLLQCFQPRLN